MTTATQKSETVLKWGKQWQDFFDNEEDETIENEDMHFHLQQNRLEMLNHAQNNIEYILEKLDEMRAIFDHLMESQHLLHVFLNEDFTNHFQSLAFEIEIDEHTVIKLEETDSTDVELMVECVITFNIDSITFRINEQSATELEIEIEFED